MAADLIRDEHVRRLFDQAPTPYLVLSPDLTIVGANEAYLSVSMTVREGIVGHPLFEVFPGNPEDPQADGVKMLRASLARVTEGLGTDTMPTQRYDIRRPDGRFVERHWTPSNTAVCDADGKIEYILHRVEDVTDYVHAMTAGVNQPHASPELEARYEQTKLQSAARQQILLQRISEDRVQLQDSVFAKDEFLKVISHELKTPITAIRGNAQILRTRNAKMNEEDRQSALYDIEFESLRLSRILDNLLLLARPELGGIETDEPCLIHRIVERAAKEHRHHFPTRSVALAHDGTPTIVVDCVETYVEQILQNLLANAEKYSPRAATITLSVGKKEGMALVSVLDSGKGFTLEQAAHVFEPYYRVADERSEQAGIGIGLAVCKRLVEVMGGSIWAASRPEGGAEVGFTIPLAVDSDDTGEE